MNSFRPSRTVENESPASDRRSGLEAGLRVPPADKLIELANKIHGARAKRRAFPNGDALSEPAWEMLLALYRADTAMHRMTVSNLCLASEAPISTALRWIDRLRELGLIRRLPNPLDSRVVFIEMEPSAAQAVTRYLSDIWLTLRQIE